MAPLGVFPAESPRRLERVAGIPIYRVTLVRERMMPYGQLRSSTDASTLLTQYLAGADREHFVVLLLDKKNKVIGINTVVRHEA